MIEQTPILLSYEVYNKLKIKNPTFLSQLETHGVQYIRYLPEYDDPTSAIGRGWRSTYLTETKEGAETALIKQMDEGQTFILQYLGEDVLAFASYSCVIHPEHR